MWINWGTYIGLILGGALGYAIGTYVLQDHFIESVAVAAIAGLAVGMSIGRAARSKPRKGPDIQDKKEKERLESDY